MNALLTQTEFDTRFVTKTLSRLATGFKKVDPSVLFLPVDSVIHYIPDVSTEMGVGKSFSVLRNSYAGTKIYHVDKLHSFEGSPINNRVAINPLKISYHKTHLEIKEVSNLDRSLTVDKSPLVINYGMLSKLYDYKSGILAEYHSWLNVRDTMWDYVHQIATRRTHFIHYKLPVKLPSRNDFNKYLHGFKAGGVTEFFTKEHFDLLELWQILHTDIVTVTTKMDETILAKTYLTFIELSLIHI